MEKVVHKTVCRQQSPYSASSPLGYPVNDGDIQGGASKTWGRNKIPWELRKTKFHDVLFIFLFLFVLGLFVIIAYENLENMYRIHEEKIQILLSRKKIYGDQGLLYLDTVFIVILLIFASFFIGCLQLIVLVFFCKVFIVSALVVNIIVGVILSVFFYHKNLWYCLFAIILFTIIVLLISWRFYDKIAFSTCVIQLGSRIIRKNFSIWLFYIITLTINSTLSFIYFLVLFSTITTWKAQSDSSLEYSIYGFLIFSGYYFEEIFQNSIQLIVGSIFAKWYFNSNIITITALYNTFVKCFGSVCFGSLFVAFISVINKIILFMKPGDKIIKLTFFKLVWKPIQLSMHILNFALQRFNEYAFAYMAIYSCGYIKSSYKMFKIYNNKGFDTLISECIIKIILKLYIILSGIIGGVSIYVYIQFFEPKYAKDQTFTWFLVGVSLIVSLQTSRLIALIINAYVHTLFICLIEHNDVVYWSHPNEFYTVLNYMSNKRAIQ